MILDRPKFSQILKQCEVKTEKDVQKDRERAQMEREKLAVCQQVVF